MKEWEQVEKPTLKELCDTIHNKLTMFSKADAYLLSIMDNPQVKAVNAAIFALYNAVLDGNVALPPKS